MNDYDIKIDCILSHCPLHGRQVIPPWGNEFARIVIVGDSPGVEEEKRNRPFAGRAGKRIKDLARRADIDWDRLFITNAVKCRIDGYDAGEKEISQAMACCKGYLDHALLSIQPAVIITCGELAFCQAAGGSLETASSGNPVWSDEYACKAIPLFKTADELYDPELESGMIAVFRIAAAIAEPEKR